MPPRLDYYAATQSPSAASRSQDRAKDQQARIAAAKLKNPAGPAQTAGSGQITNPSPILPLATDRPDFAGASQRQFRGVAQPLDVYAPPADWRGQQGVANPPPPGNQRGQYADQGWNAQDQARALQRREMRGQVASLRAGKSMDYLADPPSAAPSWRTSARGKAGAPPAAPTGLAPTPNREALLDSAMSPEGQAEAAAIDRQRIEQQYAPDSLVLKEGEGTFNTAPAKVAVAGTVTPPQPFQYKATPLPGNENWRQQVAQLYPDIMKARSEQNIAFVEAMKRDGDPNNAMQIANRLFAQPSAGNAAIAQATPVTPSAKPPGAGKAAPLSTEADFFVGNTTPEQDYRDQQAREVAQATKNAQEAQAKSDAKLAPPPGREIAPGTTGEIGAPKPRPPKYGTTGDPKRPNRLKLDPYT